MADSINIYCDESCHLKNDHLGLMALGAVWCEEGNRKVIAERIREIKEKHGLSRFYEIKWTKVSQAKRDFFLELVDYFFDSSDLHFRVVVIPGKDDLDHQRYNQTHDEFYYKMYYQLIKVILEPGNTYNVYLDIKDTRSADKVRKLGEVLQNSMVDISKQIIKHIQTIRSHESELLQLCDLLLGAVSYNSRSFPKNEGKLSVIERIKERSKYSLDRSTLPRESKFNLFFWQKDFNPEI